jgi:hypothetical protein
MVGTNNFANAVSVQKYLYLVRPEQESRPSYSAFLKRERGIGNENKCRGTGLVHNISGTLLRGQRGTKGCSNRAHLETIAWKDNADIRPYPR